MHVRWRLKSADKRSDAIHVLGAFSVVVALGVVTPLAASGAPAESAPATPRCAERSTQNPAKTLTAATEDAATLLAKDCQRPVEALDLRTGTTQVFVNPSGSKTQEQSVRPRWAKKSDGSWADIDTSLRLAASGRVEPVAAALPVSFSGGGSGPLATLKSGDRELSMSWPGDALPAPVLAGDTATYPEVRPGVDLQVTASATGFSEVLVVKTRAAAADPALRQVRFGLATKGVTVTPTGPALEARDSDGRAVFTSPTPLMWDSGLDGTGPVARTAGASTRSASNQPAARRQAAMPVRVSDGELSITPDQALLTDPEAQLPLYIDPGWDGYIDDNKTAWTMTWSNHPTTSYWNNDRALLNAAQLGTAGAGATCDHSNDQGVCVSPRYHIRTYVRMNVSGVRFKQILDAKFRIKQKWAWTCNPQTKAQLWLTDAISPATTWNRSPGAYPEFKVETPANHRVDSRYGCAGAGDIEFNARKHVEHANKWAATELTLGITSANEGTEKGWKRFDVKTAVLAIEYNTKPRMPAQQSIDGKACGSGNPWLFVPTATPVMRARVADDDGDKMRVSFVYSRYDGAQKKWIDMGGGSQNSVPHNTVGQFTAAGMQDNGLYSFRSQAHDAHSSGPASAADSAGSCWFIVDLTNPVPPTVTGDIYSNDPGACPEDEGCGGVGKTGSFTFASSPDVVKFAWGFSDPPTTQVTPSITGGAVTVRWTPDAAGPKTLFVKAVDRAGRHTTARYQFYVSGAQPAVGRWRLNDPAGSTSLQDTSGHNRNGGLAGTGLGHPGRVVGGDTALAFDGSTNPDGGAANWAGTPPGIVDTGGSFSVSAWVKVNDTSKERNVVAACGDQRCAFVLWYMKGVDRWAFSTVSADSPQSEHRAALSNTAPAVGVWTHLTGVYDAANGSVTLYVNGVKQNTVATGAKPFKAGGSMLIGYGMAGALSDVQVWNRVVSQREITEETNPLHANVGTWRMEDVGPGPSADHSGRDNHLTFEGAAEIPPGEGHPGSALRLNGSTGYARTAGPVIFTDQSFTVSAWVKPTRAGGVVISQDGTQTAPFTLQHGGAGCAGWQFTMAGADTAAPTRVRACSTVPVTLNAWTRLVAVYDAQARTMKLYVGNNPAVQAAAPATRWHAAGQLTIGRSRSAGAAADFLAGDIDEVRVYADAVANVAQLP